MSEVTTRKTRILVAGGGFGGAFVVRHLEKLCRGRDDVEITLVSRDNFFLMTPFLFEACSGTLDFRHCSVPLRAFLRRSRFVEAAVRHIDLERCMVHAVAPAIPEYELPYDQLVLALGSVTNRERIRGSTNAFTFKTLADAFVLRNHLVERFERADVETDLERKQKLLTFVVIGGGLVGVELFGELTAFVDAIVRYYRRVRREQARFILIEAGERILPEVEPRLADYAAKILGSRPGVEIRAETPVSSINPGQVVIDQETIDADTIILSAGVSANPLLATLPFEKDRHGRMKVEPTMRCPARPEVWALGDCASIPGPGGKPYPTLAQHSLREAKTLAENIHAALGGGQPQPFRYQTLGVMGSLGHSKGFGQVLGVKVRGFFAWWLRRTYYLWQFPGWSRRLRVVIDWTTALFFRPDIVKIDLARETAQLVRDAPAGAAVMTDGRAPDGQPSGNGAHAKPQPGSPSRDRLPSP